MPDQFDKKAGLRSQEVEDDCADSASNEGPKTAVSDSEAEADETTGASPGTAQACNDLGLNSLEANLARFNIKPPGQA